MLDGVIVRKVVFSQTMSGTNPDIRDFQELSHIYNVLYPYLGKDIVLILEFQFKKDEPPKLMIGCIVSGEKHYAIRLTADQSVHVLAPNLLTSLSKISTVGDEVLYLKK